MILITPPDQADSALKELIQEFETNFNLKTLPFKDSFKTQINPKKANKILEINLINRFSNHTFTLQTIQKLNKLIKRPTIVHQIKDELAPLLTKFDINDRNYFLDITLSDDPNNSNQFNQNPNAYQEPFYEITIYKGNYTPVQKNQYFHANYTNVIIRNLTIPNNHQINRSILIKKHLNIKDQRYQNIENYQAFNPQFENLKA